MLKKQKEKTFTLIIDPDLKLPYLIEIVTKPYPCGYVVPQLQNLQKNGEHLGDCIVFS